MPSNGRRSGSAARRDKVSRRAARLAREELAAGGLSHHDQRRLLAISRTWELASRRRHLEFRHLAITVLSGLVATAAIGAMLGFVPAIEAARGQGVTGTFVVGSSFCHRRGVCTWVGTFEARGEVVPDVAYEGILPISTGPGSRIPAMYPGADLAYGWHGSHAWAWDLVPMLLIGSVVAFGGWLIVAGGPAAPHAAVLGAAEPAVNAGPGPTPAPGRKDGGPS